MGKIFITCLSIFLVLDSSCQDMYVTNSGDTIHGKITNYEEWDRNPQEVTFIDNSGKSITLTPLNCKSFSAGKSDTYVSYSGPRLLNSTDIINTYGLNSSVDTTENINTFLRLIFHHKEFSLYKYLDTKRTNFFLATNGSIKELAYYEYTDDGGNTKTNEAYKIYILNQLNLVNDPDLMNKINSLVYEESALVKFFVNILRDKDYKAEKIRKNYATEILVGIGIQARFGSGVSGDGSNARQTALNPLAEIGVRFYGHRNYGKLFFEPSLIVSILNQHFTELYHISFKAQGTIVGARIGPGYFFAKKEGINFYAALPIGVDFIGGYRTTYTGSTTTQTIKSIDTPIRFVLNPEIGVDLNHKFNISLKYTTPYNFNQSNYGNLPYKTSTCSLDVSFIF